MQLLFYLLLYPLIFVISILPFPLLYLLSDIFYFFVYRIFGYRKKTVRKNLRMAFPHKSAKALLKIEKAFYKHFSDLFLEMIKAYRMTAGQMSQRLKIKNIETLNKITKKGKNIILVGGHYGNWEWVFYLAQLTLAQPIGTYLKINNKYFEKFTLKNRKRFGGELIETKSLRKTLKEFKQRKKFFLLGLLADQSPQLHRSKYWRNFLGIRVPVFVGPEELAKEYDAAVVFMKMKKIKRGYYEIDFEEITTQPDNFPNYKITDKYIELLEKQIKDNPAYYLWTHKRFKHKDRLKEIEKIKKVVIKEE